MEVSLETVLEEFSHLLWQLRDLTGNLVYRLEVQQLLLVAGRVRWIAASADDVDRAIEVIRRKEAARVRMVERLSTFLGTPLDASLRDLCAVVPTPWDVVLGEHHVEFLKLTAEAEDAARDNRELLHQGLAEVRQFLREMGGPAADVIGEQDYGERGRRSGTNAASSALLVDRDA
jgi:hypothetical protein